MSNKGKATATTVGQAVAETTQQNKDAVPAYLKDKMGQGSGLKADAEDFIVPRVKLLHGTSKEPETFNLAKVGNYWANVLDLPIGPTFDMIVCINRKRVLLMRPIDDKTGEPILARANDGKTWDKTGKWQVKLKNIKNPVEWVIDDLDVRKSGLLAFGTGNPDDEDSNPAATVFFDYLVYLPAFPQLGPVLFSLARTGAKRAKELNSKIEMRGGPMQSLKFTVGVSKEGEVGNEYYNTTFQSNGFATEDEFNKCMAIAKRFEDFQGAGEEETADTAAAPAPQRDGKSEV